MKYLTADIRTQKDVAFLVKRYYAIQKDRITMGHQIRTAQELGEPYEAFQWLFDHYSFMEAELKKALGRYAEDHPVGRWMMSHKGMGPVLAAGMLAYVDIERAVTPGHILSYGNMAGTPRRAVKGSMRDWNADFKCLLWKIGESFVKASGRKQAYYGQWYAKHKRDIAERNDRKEFAYLAQEAKVGKNTEAYKYYSQGKLPPAHVHAMARRKAIHLFVHHFWEKMYKYHFKKKPKLKPWVVEHQDKVYIEPFEVEI